MFDQNIKPDVRLMTEGISFIMAALIQDSARFSNLAPVLNPAATNQANKATRIDVTSHHKLSMQLSFNMGNFSATHYNQKDVDSTRIDVFLALRRNINSLKQHTVPNENEKVCDKSSPDSKLQGYSLNVLSRTPAAGSMRPADATGQVNDCSTSIKYSNASLLRGYGNSAIS